MELKNLQDVLDEHLTLIKATAEAMKATGIDQERLEQLLLKFTKEDAEIWTLAAARMNQLEIQTGHLNATLEGMEKRANFFEDRLRDLEGEP